MASKAELEHVNMKYARLVSTLSKCEERNVGAVVTDATYTRVYSLGYNGGPSGLLDCMCNTEGKYGCLHAEINALIKCTTDDKNKVMFVTLAPCKQCAAAIINSGFSKVIYAEEWKDKTGLKLLEEAGITTVQYVL